MKKLKVLTYEELKNLVNKNEYNWSVIAKAVDESQGSVSNVARRKNRNSKIAKAIQVAASVPFESIFGMTEAEYEESCAPRFRLTPEKSKSQQAKLTQALNA